MDNIRLISLYSGSSGNAFLVTTPVGNFLIDGGKSARRLTAALRGVGVEPSELSFVLLTHDHTDHTAALPNFLKKTPLPVYLPIESAPCFSVHEALRGLLLPRPPIFDETLPSGIRVRSFPTLHDSRGSFGFRVEIPFRGKTFSLGYATDLGRVTDDVREGLRGCHAVVLESNHDSEMLRRGPYPPELKRRISSPRGHLSNEACADLLPELFDAGARVFFLAHLSRENNRPELAYDAALSALGERAEILVEDPEEAIEWNTEGMICFN